MNAKIVLIFIIFLSTYCHGETDSTADFEKKWNDKLQDMKNAFNRTVAQLKDEFQEFKNPKGSEASDCPKDWIPYSNTKCVKSLDVKQSYFEAKSSCLTLESNVLSIHSEDENQFIVKALINSIHISDSVWLGLELINETYKWSDGNDLGQFRPFEKDNSEESDETNNERHDCVKMSLEGSDAGEWDEEKCRKKHLVVCERKQTSKRIVSDDMKQIHKEFNDFMRGLGQRFPQLKESVVHQMVESLKKNDSNQAVLIPVGFIYTQFPRQKAPQEIWPQMKWKDITSEYAGLFFRAEGGRSYAFGKEQSDRTRSLDSVKSHGDGYDEHNKDVDLKPGERSPRIYTGAASSVPNVTNNWALSFKVNDGEVRPRNTAIRIWERVDSNWVNVTAANVTDNYEITEKMDAKNDEVTEVVTEENAQERPGAQEQGG